MVRIEQVERAAAVASLLGDPGSNGSGSDTLESAAAE
jgi:hypothetical protein